MHLEQNLDVHEEAAKRKQQQCPHEHEPLHGVELTSPHPPYALIDDRVTHSVTLRCQVFNSRAGGGGWGQCSHLDA